MYPRIRALREDRDLKQSAVAALLHISQATYSRYESGALDIPTGVLIALAAFYGVSTDYLLGLTARPEPYPPKYKKERRTALFLFALYAFTDSGTADWYRNPHTAKTFPGPGIP